MIASQLRNVLQTNLVLMDFVDWTENHCLSRCKLDVRVIKSQIFSARLAIKLGLCHGGSTYYYD